MKRILICTDSFKDYKSSLTIANELKSYILSLSKDYEVQTLPLADGGEGSVEVLSFQLGLPIQYSSVLDPLGREVQAAWLMDSLTKTAYIGMAEASGIELLAKDERNCFHTSTYGTGQVIQTAIALGAQSINIFVGGSATCDMGLGMATALGSEFYSKKDKISQPKGRDLLNITQYSKKTLPNEVSITVYTDVNNPLYGAFGAAHIYGPQKGASPKEVINLDKGLQNIRKLILEKDGVEVNFPKAGAAGGISAGAFFFLDAKVKMGTDYLFDLMQVETAVQGSDIIITGEGKLDHQTFSGKLVKHICKLAKDKKTLVLCGKNELSRSEFEELYIDDVVALSELGPQEKREGKIVDSLHLAAPFILDILS